MTNTETKTEEISEVQKADPVVKTDDPSALQILAQIVQKQDVKIDGFQKSIDALTAVVKEHNANPVDSGVEAENKPKTEDADDVGDKVTIGNEVAPKPSDSQASIIAPALETNTADKEGLKMENKADDDDKKEDKKEEVAKTDDDKKDEDKKEEIKKSDDSTYEIVKTVRPKVYIEEVRKSVPTGYQVIKAAASGWDGATQSAEEALVIMYNKEANGEFGNGQPQGAY